ncbi:MAG: carbamoyl phosphate synthase small subunit, partial [Phycisphaeraceae bacterium]|nr:carbamoyl phosphate synthase small subunit [Phycisphaeraceae bacterium]
MSQTPTSARLALADGSIFTARPFGWIGDDPVEGEVCFNTSMTGYQEILTDPSYAGQIVTMTCPQIGNYGTNDLDLESRQIFVKGFVVRELSNIVSNYRSQKILEDWLAERRVTGLTGLDTRAVTRKLRTTGALNGVICTDASVSDADLVARARAATGLVGVDWVSRVTQRDQRRWSMGLGDWAPLQGRIETVGERMPIVAIDCGMKWNILRNLVESGCDVEVVPNDEPAGAILERKPRGVFVSNGPG